MRVTIYTFLISLLVSFSTILEGQTIYFHTNSFNFSANGETHGVQVYGVPAGYSLTLGSGSWSTYFTIEIRDNLLIVNASPNTGAAISTSVNVILRNSGGSIRYSKQLTLTQDAGSTSALLGGTIGCAVTTVSVNSSPGVIYNSTSASGGQYPKIYFWESSPDGSSWTTVQSNSGTSYTPSALTATTYYRRKVMSGPVNVYSNTVVITVSSSQSPTKPTIGSISPSNENYILVTTPRVECTSEASLNSLTLDDASVGIEYFDGLGRPKQSIGVGASPSGLDIVTPKDYDQYGREAVKYLPFASSTTAKIVDDPLSKQLAFYASSSNDIINDSSPFMTTVFDNSPLNRVIEQGAVGSSWQPTTSGTSHTVKNDYQANGGTEVLKFTSSESSVTKTGFYPQGSLYKTVVKDENWKSSDGNLHTTESFSTAFGLNVLKRSYVKVGSTVTPVDTYYIYDNRNQLKCVISPEGSKRIEKSSTPLVLSDSETTIMKPYCYFYKYDDRGRMCFKQLPGAEAIYMVYDKRDRLVATQDGNQRSGTIKKWGFIKYDTFNRPIATGVINSSSTYDALQDLMDSWNNPMVEERSIASNNYHGYTHQAWPISGIGSYSYLTVTYYDSYGAEAKHYTKETGISDYELQYPNTPNTAVKGQVVRTRTQVLDDNSFTTNAKFLDQELYYDDRYRVIKSVEQLYYNGSSSWSNYQVISTKYDFAGTIEKTRTKHYLGGSTNIIEQEYSYDHVGRLTTVTHKLNNNTKQILSTQTYNDLGVLKQKIVGGSSSTICAQIMDYSYNIRGWLTSINDVNSSSTGKKLFSMELLYESTSGLPSTTTAQYNGNISGVKWRTPANSNIESPSSIQTYGYVYDGLNRLQTAKYLESNRTEYYDVAIGNYDLNGNIGTITRKHKGSLIDNLTLGYSGNRLLYVNDNYADDNMGFTEVSASLSEYSYDSNGNMTKDNNKSLFHIDYNVLNLPSKLIGNGTNINYIYDGSGRKLVKSVTGGSSPTYYYGALVFDGSSLDYVLHDEGMVEFASSSTGSYSYHLKDHLGNVRMVVDAGEYAEQQNDYYPFGMEFASGGVSSNKYKYNGKEAQDDYIGVHKLGWLDYGARMYDPAIGRWNVMDPLAEKYEAWSPYNYCVNNPVLNIDPDGMDWYSYTDDDGSKHYKYQDGSDETIKVGDNTYTNIGANVSIQLGEGYYLNAFQNYTVTSLDRAIDVRQKILNSPKLQGRLLSEGSGFSEQGQGQIMEAIIHRGHSNFINHSVTQATVHSLLFIATGGIEGLMSLGSAARGGFNLLKGGKSFSQFKYSYWAGRTKPTLDAIINPETGQVWKQYMELHHRFIPQRAKWAPNWLKNNRLNLTPASSLRHAQMDPYRARFAPKWIKELYNLKYK